MRAMSEPVSGINPHILEWARRRSGQTIEDVAAALNKAPDVVESWERGRAAPTYVQLETLAYRLYKRPMALFFFPEPPREPDPEGSFRTLPKAEIEDLAADTRYKIREARAMQVSLAELTGGTNPAARQILRDVSASASQNAATIATRARSYLGVDLKTQKEQWRGSDDALKAWRARVENAGVFVFKDSLKQKEISGFALDHPEFPLILINNSTATTRQIFTLFHELAHLLLHTNGVTKRDDRYLKLLTGEPRRIEILCNRFAAELLVPAADLELTLRDFGADDAAVARIAGLYKVSREVILRRLLNINWITVQRYESKVAQLSDEYEASAAPPKGGGNYYATHASYLSERYARLAFGNYYRGAISIEQLADYLNVSARSVPGIEQLVLQRPAS
jgi:Zn-dependent peptidase ImmA (M78 family)/transcriptional regulator with XRE-family HTH domain